MLKKIIIGAAFSALIASSAMAQSYQPEWGSGNIVPGPNGGFVSAPYDGERFGGPSRRLFRWPLTACTSGRPCITATGTTRIVSGTTTKVEWL